MRASLLADSAGHRARLMLPRGVLSGVAWPDRLICSCRSPHHFELLGVFWRAPHRPRPLGSNACYWFLVVRSSCRLPHRRLFHGSQVRRSEIERHVADLAAESEWHLIVLV